MDSRIDAAYGRQSVDRKDSISIESQLEFCRHELRGGEFKEYTDKGFSGKNTDRPKFQEMLRDIKAGLIKRVVVYKLDRISRSILDFAGLMAIFQEYNVEFISSTEKFDTSTPMGRAMLNICIVFAQLERETIQKRVLDACQSRSVKGLRIGGRIPFGFSTEPCVMAGVNTKKYAAKETEIGIVKMLFEMYAQQNVSLGDIARYLVEQDIRLTHNPNGFQRVTMSRLLRSPVYVKADMDIYEFYKSQGAVIINDAADFTGTNGCYLYANHESKDDKGIEVIAGKTLVLAPHEGIVPSDVWLACRRKLMVNQSFQAGRKVKNSWLAGKTKCVKCGYALKAVGQYMRCTKHRSDKSCTGAGTIRVDNFEAFIYSEMVAKLQEFHTLTEGKNRIVNPKETALKVELARIEAEIEKFIDSLTGASDILMSYANTKMAELDARRQSVVKQLAEFAVMAVPTEQIVQVSAILDDWDNADIEGKRLVVDSLIIKVLADSESIDIQWKI